MKILTSRQKLNKSIKFINDLKFNNKIIPFLQPQQIQRLGLYDFKFINRKTIKFSFIQQKLKQNKYIQFQQFISDLKLVFEMIEFYVPLNDPLQVDVKYFLNQVEKWRNIMEGNGVIEENININSNGKVKGNKNTSNSNINNLNNNTIKDQLLQQSKPQQSIPNNHSKFNSNKKSSHSQHYQRQRLKKITNYARIQQQKQRSNPFTKPYRQAVRSSLAQKIEMIYFLKSHQLNQPFIHMIGDKYRIGKEIQDQYMIKLDNSTSCAWLQVLHENNLQEDSKMVHQSFNDNIQK